jgi:hypothetical protein
MNQRPTPQRIKHTVAPPEICRGCYWEWVAKHSQALNKKLRRELLQRNGAKLARAGSLRIRGESEEREERSHRRHDEEHDLLDEMTQQGQVDLDLG